MALRGKAAFEGGRQVHSPTWTWTPSLTFGNALSHLCLSSQSGKQGQ